MLELINIRVGYGQSVVLQDVSLNLREGEIVCLLGANGAGKTTTTRVVSGLLAPWAGEIRYAGENIATVPAHKRVELGICLSPEGRQVFPNFSVYENLLLGSFSKKARLRRTEMFDEVYGLFPRLAERRKQKAGLMSGGEQQMLAIGRALMGCPKLLMLDEPSLGLGPKIIIDVYEAVASIAKRGLSILFVEQNVQAALMIAHRGYVLANGHIAAEGTSAELRSSPLVQEAFLGKKPSRQDLSEVHRA
ncbi:MAG: ABC transporter ATP-binding protein [Pseudolabrys sp.]|nr:ABC transporter ATP-binding protein [Pseudolabrys sp.]MDP2297025.1 ABC transporter ATP-binding protein [Pseudolabrys sp.]